MRKITALLTVVLLILACEGTSPEDRIPTLTGRLVINELMASNDSSFTDESGEYDDWLELYNGTELPIDVGGMYLADDVTDSILVMIPDTMESLTTIQSHGHLLLWCDRQSYQGALHLDFKLSASGEIAILYAVDGLTVLDSIRFPQVPTDMSYGRFNDGDSIWVIKDVPSPGTSN